MDVRELYQEVILDHSRRPRNFGRPPACNREAKGHNPLCGDRISIYLDIVDGVNPAGRLLLDWTPRLLILLLSLLRATEPPRWRGRPEVRGAIPAAGTAGEVAAPRPWGESAASTAKPAA